MQIIVPTLAAIIGWAVLLAVLVAVEAATVNLVSIWFAVGALAALLASLFTQNLLYQVLVFLLVSALALAVTKPLVDKSRRKKPAAPLGLQRNIGRRATVVRPIAPGQPGRVRLDGVDWAAASGAAIGEGQECLVTGIDSSTLLVEPAAAPCTAT